MIELHSLTKRFGTLLAVDGVSFRVEPGEVLGFLGPNGAGKSTTMKMVTGFLAPTAGTAVVAGHDVLKDPIRVKESLGYLPEGAPAYPDMTPESFLNFVATVRGLSGRERRERLDDAVAKVHLEEVMRQPIETLSKGFKRRVGLAQAILHDPAVLIMDEPTDGLDPNQKHEVRTLIRTMAPRKAIILSTHILEEVEAVCTRTVIIARGRVVFDGTPAALAARSPYHNAVTVVVRGVPAARLCAELGRIDGAAEAVPVEPTLQSRLPGEDPPLAVPGSGEPGRPAACTVFPKRGRSIAAEVARAARAKNWEVDELRVETGRLDEVFRELTGGATGGMPVASHRHAGVAA